VAYDPPNTHDKAMKPLGREDKLKQASRRRLWKTHIGRVDSAIKEMYVIRGQTNAQGACDLFFGRNSSLICLVRLELEEQAMKTSKCFWGVETEDLADLAMLGFRLLTLS